MTQYFKQSRINSRTRRIVAVEGVAAARIVFVVALIFFEHVVNLIIDSP